MRRIDVQERQAGVGVIGILLWMILLLLLLLALHLQLANLVSAGAGLDSQLYSFVLAENGLEFARSVMQVLETNQLIAGQDGLFDSTFEPGWRNPLSFSEARELDLGKEWVPVSDDGLPWSPATGEVNARLRLESGDIFLRFSNNPEEDPGSDQDGELVVRSMGVTTSLAANPLSLSLGLRNQATLLEARLRHSRYFQSTTPVVLWESGLLNGGAVFLSAGDTWVGWIGSEDRADQALSLLRDQFPLNLQFPEPVQNVTASYRENGHRKTMFEDTFWENFSTQLAEFIDERVEDRLFYLPAGGTLQDSRTGLVVAGGSTTVAAGCRINGLLLHLGPGDLVLQDGARVKGAVWVVSSHPSPPGSATLRLESGSQIELDPVAVDSALRILPADLTGFRILFTEMKQ